MGNDHDYLALDWVKGEIEETLKQARQSLESFVSNPEDSTRMRFCLTYLHQVYGTLQMVEFYGAALLAEEMEQLAQAILNGAVARADDAEEVLMRSILQLPVYLDKVRSARRDLPVVILPLLNDLRATRGESLLSETALFAPNLESGKEIATRQLNVSERINNPSQLLRRYRQMYQISLVGLIRGNDLVTNLGNLAKVLAKMEGLAGNSKSSQLWWIGGAIAEGLANNSVETSTSVKMLLGLVDRQIKLAIDTDGSSLAEDVPEELIKNLLYYVAKSDAQSPRIKAVKEAYNLDEAIISYDGDDGDQQLLAGPDREAMESVVAAISEEINAVKEVLDIFVRRKDKNFGELSQLIPTIKQISDTLAVLGLGVQRRVVREQIDEVEWCVANQDNSAVDTRLLDVAG
ncbi:MAG: Hpt domain-containing protein, partial [Gammaproteobacteria bacterium]|nr:Hpt domain-containing protein [Gammaproteobacteria bacterium]